MAELARQVLHSLPRSDQRRSGELYIRGLLAAQGRKTIRNVASPTGRTADAQRLHHFISESTWDWIPVRRALADRLAREVQPSAWVVQAVAAPRTCRAPAGPDSGAVPRAGVRVNGQHSVGLWAVTPLGGFPADWRLLLPQRWLDDPRLRARAGIPQDARPLDAVGAGLDMLPGFQYGARGHAPVLLDARRTRAAPTVAALGVRGLPHLLRVSASELLVPAGEPPRRTRAAVTAGQLAADASAATRLATTGPTGAPHEVSRFVCRVPGAGASRRSVLLVDKDPRHPRRAAFWLTDLTDHPIDALVRLTRAPGLVAGEAAGTGRRVGLYDFAGRSFAGWHRHTTLASVAHTAALLLPARTEDASRTGIAC
ncbi:transposase [Streptomyces sp. HNM0645]|uniref:IS701 family transposase n=1 Tax=Streptomyces sp. HNM0645 TaxID=2782343 RepID=UPI0024B68193|nr:transposase [Streptomyces sp. HNM0645]MDI9883307.1 transposase [Streptomyces sp. HNM0645]